MLCPVTVIAGRQQLYASVIEQRQPVAHGTRLRQVHFGMADLRGQQNNPDGLQQTKQHNEQHKIAAQAGKRWAPGAV